MSGFLASIPPPWKQAGPVPAITEAPPALLPRCLSPVSVAAQGGRYFGSVWDQSRRADAIAWMGWK